MTRDHYSPQDDPLPRLPGVLRTLPQARDYARAIAQIRHQEVFLFKVPKGIGAYACGYRYGVCVASEKAEYEADGAVFIESVALTPSPNEKMDENKKEKENLKIPEKSSSSAPKASP